jgi:hypothetical protein
MRSRVWVSELEGKSVDEMTDLIDLDPTLLQAVLSLIAVAVAIVPVAGTVVSMIALFACRKIPAWPKTVSWIALFLSFVSLAWFCATLILERAGVIR